MQNNKSKIYLNRARENWIVDRLTKEFCGFNKTKTTKFISQSDKIWIIAPWVWKNISKKHLINKKVLCTIHHIDQQKFDTLELKDFKERDVYIDQYHVTNDITYQKLSDLTNKRIVKIPFWINHDKFFNIQDRDKLRKKFNLNSSDFLIGSFQRDSEGSNLLLPKLSKGPDQFIKIIEYLNNQYPNLTVVLTGWRRDFIINKLRSMNINFRYFEKINTKISNELYNCLDLYIVASRVEGGPMAILEAGLTKTPIISTDVGIASDILSSESIFNMDNYKTAKPNIEYAYLNSLKFTQENINNQYLKIFENLNES